MSEIDNHPRTYPATVTQSQPCTCGECGTCMEPLAHPKFSFGMLLEAKHLALEHRYHALRMDTHDIRLHDFGTVCGLRVDKHPSPECVNRYVILRPGLALDCCGREIVVPSDLYIPLFDGAKSGWCGAPVSEPPQPVLPVRVAAEARKILYIYLRYRQCDTDPIPSYVKNCGGCGCGGSCGGGCGGSCGCGGGCHESNCVLSITREGYEVSVSTTPPPVWRNPVSAAFCDWLSVQLKGERGAGMRDASRYEGSLQHALCEVITQPCADTCGGGNDELLLATVTFKPDDTLQAIDNCTNRRLVVSTGAIFESLGCVLKAVIACCGGTIKALPKLDLIAHVNPTNIDLPTQPLSTTIVHYEATAHNASTTSATGSFELQVLVDSRLTVKSTVPVAATTPTPGGTTVTISVPALVAKGTSTLTIDAAFAEHTTVTNSDIVVSTASIANYGAPSDAPVVLKTTFTGAVNLDGPRVIYEGLPTSWSVSEVLGSLVEGIPVKFDSDIDTGTTVPLTSPGVTGSATVSLSITVGATAADASQTYPLATRLIWTAAVMPTTKNIKVAVVERSALNTLLEKLKAKIAERRASVTLELLGGPKGSPGSPAIAGPTMALRLDGSPTKGGSPVQIGGRSGDGTQGGDFVWQIAITPQ